MGVAAVLVGAAFAGATPASAREPDNGVNAVRTASETRQHTYAKAAAEYHVPLGVLLAVSYLESRWNTNGGAPSTSAGYGPMHLTDVATAGGVDHHADAAEDARGDDRRPLLTRDAKTGGTKATVDLSPLRTLEHAADLTGSSAKQLREDPAANIAGGAALLADYQRALGLPLSMDPAKWYAAVARYSGSPEQQAAQAFANDAFKILSTGAARVTDDGQLVTLAPTKVTPARSDLRKLGLRAPSAAQEAECPAGLGCEWLPAPYQQFGDPIDYGNHDISNRPETSKIDYIVIHDTETTYDRTVGLVLDVTNSASWHYSVRTQDGHIAQHIKGKDVGWHAGNWFINGKSIGIEHEGYAARGTWYTETMYRNSARLVRYLADKYDIPLDRQHIIGHDNVIGPLNANLRTTHWDPGPYWDWSHYFDLMGAPFKATARNAFGGMVTINPDFSTNRPAFTDCEVNPGPPDEGTPQPCGSWGSSSVHLRTEPRDDAPLLKDIGRNPPDGVSTMKVSDHGSRASAGTQFAIAGRRGDWTAVWYLAQKGWFKNPANAPTALWASGLVVTPKAGRDSIPIYGRAYPEPSAFPPQVPVQSVTPLMYNMPAGQRYPLAFTVGSEYFWSEFDSSKNVFVRGTEKYHQIQWGQRIGYVKVSDVDIKQSGPRR